MMRQIGSEGQAAGLVCTSTFRPTAGQSPIGHQRLTLLGLNPIDQRYRSRQRRCLRLLL